ncbi:hypothetical protein MSG28_005598 [Choristoneura fumiferana]|uniref:Uncharacterized protein n=1 Tax=Choristoneura fumiferana TaxID=7141 RepID=A0ACC0KZC1_CHOFU|nr:hypothetical protein MSG28_005598 [Choristoneura fumiferana]
MSERYPGYLFGGTPVSSWDRSFNSLENLRLHDSYGVTLPRSRHRPKGYGQGFESNQIQQQYRGRYGGLPRCWGSMSEGGGVSAAGDSCRTNLIVNYLPQTMTEKDLYAMFMTIGPIESSITEDQLETIFGKYGRIVQKHILRDKSNGTPRGVAFVRFDKREEAQEAIAALNNVIPEGGTEPLSVKVSSIYRRPMDPRPVLPQRHHSLDQLDMLHSRQDYATSYNLYSNPSNRYLRRDYHFHQPSYMPHHRPF